MKQVPNYPKLYATQDGHIWDSEKKCFLEEWVKNKNYLAVRYFLKGQPINPKVHRLVAFAYIPNPNNYPQVNHLDGDMQNNRPENLEWCTNEMNLEHAKKMRAEKKLRK